MAEPVVVEPWDEHNRALVENVHPAAWTNPEPAPRYNLVVIGAGTAGLVTAIGAAGLGRARGPRRARADGRGLPERGLRAIQGLARVRPRDGRACARPIASASRCRRARASTSPRSWRGCVPCARGSARPTPRRRYRDLGVDVFFGAGRFTGPSAVDVDGQSLRFSKAVIATGARAAAPPIPGLAESGYLTNETVFTLTALPIEARRDRRRPHRLRARPGLRALRRRGDGARGGAGDPRARGRRRRRAGGEGAGPRRRPPPRRLQDLPRGGGGTGARDPLRARRGDGPARRRPGAGRGGPRAERGGSRPRRGRRGRSTRRRSEGRRPPAHDQPAHLRRRRRVLAASVHPQLRLPGARRDPERALLRARPRERPHHPARHLHRSRGRPRGARRARRLPSARSRSARSCRSSPRWTAPCSTARRRAS